MKLVLQEMPSVEKRNIEDGAVRVYCTVGLSPEDGDTLKNFEEETTRLKGIIGEHTFGLNNGRIGFCTSVFVSLDKVVWSKSKWIADAEATRIGLENKLGCRVVQA